MQYHGEKKCLQDSTFIPLQRHLAQCQGIWDLREVEKKMTIEAIGLISGTPHMLKTANICRLMSTRGLETFCEACLLLYILQIRCCQQHQIMFCSEKDVLGSL